MTFYEALNIDLDIPELISVVGAGGKTSTMFRLSREFKAFRKKVLVTTTTNIAFSETSQADHLFIGSSKNISSLPRVEPGTIVCLGSSMVGDQEKLKGIEREFVDEIYQEHLFDYILVEADGSRRRPIKAPAHYEPVIPKETTRVIGVIGLDALGKPITDQYVHRPSLFCSITGKKMGDTIDRKCLIHLILSQDGLFKDVPPDCKKYVVFNKADHTDRREEAKITANELIGRQPSVDGFIITATDNGYVYAEWVGHRKWETGLGPFRTAVHSPLLLQLRHFLRFWRGDEGTSDKTGAEYERTEGKEAKEKDNEAPRPPVRTGQARRGFPKLAI